jgi:hypothetical protein
MLGNFFEASHPIDGSDIIIEYDSDGDLLSATYCGDDTHIDTSNGEIKAKLQADIDHYLLN